MQIIVSLVLTAILAIWGEDMLLLFGASENTIRYASDYLRIYAFGTIFVQLTLGMKPYITAQGFTNFAMISVIIGAVCNIVLDPIFILHLIWAYPVRLWQRYYPRLSPVSGLYHFFAVRRLYFG